MTREELLDPFVRLLDDICPPSLVRAIEAGASPEPLWAAIEASGYLDALVPEAAGGAGLTLAQVAPLLMALGRHALPLPAAETMAARALLARAGVERPQGPILLLAGRGSAPVPLARVADRAIVALDGRLVLAPLDQATLVPTGEPHSLAAALAWPAAVAGVELAAGSVDLAALAAVLSAAAIAGAADRLLEMTVAYADERSQFGKPIGRQQAIQQQMAVMAEQVVAARIAAEIGCAAGLDGDGVAAAVAKRTTGAAAAIVADIAHAVHGAIGISEECDVQLHTRRLREWRLAGGGEGHWAARLGAARLAEAGLSSVDFVRMHVDGGDRFRAETVA